MPGPPRPGPGPAVPGPAVPGPAEAAPATGTGTATVTASGAAAGTGDPRVDAALARLDRLDGLPVAEHVGEYDAVHRALQDALTAIDES
ncbi:MAG: hypothetical protein JWN54_1921 [Mycobacterium sp.]|jgi:hypothetical protein|nr:hypothetical protein [Mycobacterium sp.]